MNKIIEDHREIWRQQKEGSELTLGDVKPYWLETLDEDPEMKSAWNWGSHLANKCSEQEIQEFREWLESDND